MGVFKSMIIKYKQKFNSSSFFFYLKIIDFIFYKFTLEISSIFNRRVDVPGEKIIELISM